MAAVLNINGWIQQSHAAEKTRLNDSQNKNI